MVIWLPELVQLQEVEEEGLELTHLEEVVDQGEVVAVEHLEVEVGLHEQNNVYMIGYAQHNSECSSLKKQYLWIIHINKFQCNMDN